MRSRVVVLVRALSGGEVDDRDAVKVIRALRADGAFPPRTADALVTALERAEVQAVRGQDRRLGLHTAAGALFGGIGGAAGLWALGGVVTGATRWTAVLPLIGVVAVLTALVRVRRYALDGLALPVAVAHNLMRAGVTPGVAVDAAVHVAGRRGDALRGALASVVVDGVEADAPESSRIAAAVLAGRFDDASGLERARNRARWSVLAAALWVVGSFWVAWIYSLAGGLEVGP